MTYKTMNEAMHTLRYKAALVVVFAVFSVVAAVADMAAVAADEHDTKDTESSLEKVLYVSGGGWGRSVGMSQYGALGRAEAGHSYTEILQFYYHDTEVVAAPELVPDDIDVRIDVHNQTVFTPTGELAVHVDNSLVGSSVNRLQVERVDSGWRITDNEVAWCGGVCSGDALTIHFNSGEPVRVSKSANYTRSYAYGEFQLTPASEGVENCGDEVSNEYCLVVGNLTMQQYLYGLHEVPLYWHEEALRAQAVAARSYAAAQVRDRSGQPSPFDMYTSGQSPASRRDQEYRGYDNEIKDMPSGSWKKAVDDTADVVVVYTCDRASAGDQCTPDAQGVNADVDTEEPNKRRVVTAYYSSSNGGYTLSSEASWGVSVSYLRSKRDVFDAALGVDGVSQNRLHEWYRSYGYVDVSRWLAEYELVDLDVGDLVDVRVEPAEGVEPVEPAGGVGDGSVRVSSGHINRALVTLVGSERTLEVRDANGEPYGFYVYDAIQRGCRKSRGCRGMLSTNITLSNNPPPASVNASSSASTPEVLHVSGGGSGHGVGMSQYGALGRAEAGHSYAEILQFYYHDTEVVSAPELVPDRVDVLVDVADTTAFTPTGKLVVYMDGTFLDTTWNRLTVGRREGGWYINSSNIDWCKGFCRGSVLTVSFTDGEPVRVTRSANKTRFYAYGEFQLTPADTLTPADIGASDCGDSDLLQYCLVVKDLTMQQYLYGLNEMPGSWHGEALRAQAVAARSHTAARIKARDTGDLANGIPLFDMHASTQNQSLQHQQPLQHQQYRGWDNETADLPDRSWVKAVDDTANVVVAYTCDRAVTGDQCYAHGEQQVADTYYSSSNGGYTLSSEASWGVSVSYLRSKRDVFDAALGVDGVSQNRLHEWYRSYGYVDVSRWLAEYELVDLDVGDLVDVRVEPAEGVEPVEPGVGDGSVRVSSGHINRALVTLVGSKRTLEVRDANGEPYGFYVYDAIQRGCRKSRGCRSMLSTNITLSNEPPPGNTHDFQRTSNEKAKLCNFLCPTAETFTSSASSSVRRQTNPCSQDYLAPEFSDVPANSPYNDAVNYLIRHSITKGTTPTTFSPEKPVTRAEFVTFLWRFFGCPRSQVNIMFSDLAEHTSDFSEATSWIWENGVAYRCATVRPDRLCANEKITGAEIAAVLWRVSGGKHSEQAIFFEDVTTGTYYEEPVRWMVEWNLWVDPAHSAADDLPVLFQPETSVSRSRVAMYLWNLACTPEAFRFSDAQPLFMRKC